jgi:hypothetical protein
LVGLFGLRTKEPPTQSFEGEVTLGEYFQDPFEASDNPFDQFKVLGLDLGFHSRQ